MVRRESIPTLEVRSKYSLTPLFRSRLVETSKALLIYSDDVDIQLASRIGRIAESLISEHRNEHSLRARSSLFLGTLKAYVEPFQAGAEHCRNGEFLLHSLFVHPVDENVLLR